MRGNWKKASYLFATFLILILVVLICNVEIEQAKIETSLATITDKEFETFIFANCHTEKNEDGDTVYIPDNSDPMVTLPAINKEINCIEINLKSPVKRDTSVEVYYAKKGEFFSEAAVQTTAFLRGEDLASVYIPKGVYAQIRLDINGEFTIKSVEYGLGHPAVSEDFSGISYYYKINWMAILALACLLVSLKAIEKSYGYYSELRQLLKRIIDKIGWNRDANLANRELYSTEKLGKGNDSEARRLANIFAACALIFGLLIIFLTPPMTSPDEDGHFQNICRISSGNFFADVAEDGTRGSILDKSEISFMRENFDEYVFTNLENKYNFQKVLDYSSKYKYSGERVFYPTGHASINPLAYVSSSIGASLVKIFSSRDVYTVWVAARLSNLVFSVIIIHLAILKTPFMRKTLFLLALMPMTLYQLCSVNYDVETMCGSFLLFAYTAKIVCANDTYRVTLKDTLAIWTACACLCASKVVFLALAVILFSIGLEKFGSKKRYYLAIASVICVVIICYAIPNLLNNHGMSEFQNANINDGYEAVFTNYEIIPTVVINSLHWNMALCKSSFVGFFGWFEVPIPNPFINFYYIVTIVVAVIELCSVRKLNMCNRLLSFISAVAIITAMIIGMYVAYWGYGGSYARGLQGRYFIPVAIYLPLFLANPLLLRFQRADKVHEYATHISKWIAVSYLALTCAVIFTAYWL